jgi:hypothetical protein
VSDAEGLMDAAPATGVGGGGEAEAVDDELVSDGRWDENAAPRIDQQIDATNLGE